MLKLILIASVFIYNLTALATSFENFKKAYYEVPTAQLELKADSQFKLNLINISKDQNNITTINYVIPEELTGEINHMTFSGRISQGVGHLTGTNGTMDCISNTKNMMCSVKYQNLNFNTAAAKLKLSDEFSGLQLQNKLALQEKFSTDPIGIIHLSLR